MKRLTVFISVIVLLFLAVLIWFQLGKQAVNATDTSSKIFVIPPGATVREIGNKLKSEGLIRDPVVFFLYVKQQGKDRSIQAGDYRLSPSMNLEALLKELTHGTLDKWVTFNEGLRAEEYAEILKKEFKAYNPSWDALLAQENGYLFPDTYLLPVNSDINIIIAAMKKNFYSQVEPLGLTETSPNLVETVIVASLIEREVKKDEEKALVASVIYNRINAGMPLQIDATVQYALGKSSGRSKWWQPVTAEDLGRIDSPYNTYQNTGLPPTPISNPGLASIKAALNPSNTDYFFYISEDNGTSHFAKTLEEHNRNIERYLR